MASTNPTKSPSEDSGRIYGEVCTRKRLETVKEYLDQKQWKPYNESSASDAKIRRWRYGIEDHERHNKTILMLGETGTGKTTLLNTLVNHMMRVKFEDKVWYEITEEQPQDTFASQTACVTMYEIHIEKSPFSLTIVDTPGYGDTRDMDHDNDITDYLCELFESYGGIDRINAVCLVVKSSQNRLTDFQNYIFDSVLSLFGKDIQNNVVIFFTHSDGLPPTGALNAVKKAKTRCAMDEDGDPIHFVFNNRQCETYKKNQAKFYAHFWRMGESSIKDFFKYLKGTKSQSLKMTTDVLRKRKQLEAHLQELIATIDMANEEEKQLEEITKVVRENKAKVEANESFEFWTEETMIMKVPVKDYFTNCTEKAMCCDTCKKNCHFPGCTWVVNLWWCAVMSGGKCTVCGCSYEKHTKEDKLYMPVTKKVKKTNEDLKRKYQNDHGKTVDIQRKIEEDLTTIKRQMSRLLQEAYDAILRLDEIALLHEPLSTAIDVDSLIEKMAKSNQHDMVKKLNEIKNRAPAASKNLWKIWKKIHI